MHRDVIGQKSGVLQETDGMHNPQSTSDRPRQLSRPTYGRRGFHRAVITHNDS